MEKKIIREHKCFNCSRSFKWKAEIKNGSNYGVGPVEIVGEEAKAEIAFVESNKIEVNAFCPNCKNRNKFIETI